MHRTRSWNWNRKKFFLESESGFGIKKGNSADHYYQVTLCSENFDQARNEDRNQRDIRPIQNSGVFYMYSKNFLSFENGTRTTIEAIIQTLVVLCSIKLKF